jgi:hypothetical protein
MVNKTQDLDVLEEAVAGIYLRQAECRIEPIVGRTYYVYLREDKTSFTSIVEPQYWDYERFPMKFVCKATYNESGWRELPTE